MIDDPIQILWWLSCIGFGLAILGLGLIVVGIGLALIIGPLFSL